MRQNASRDEQETTKSHQESQSSLHPARKGKTGPCRQLGSSCPASSMRKHGLTGVASSLPFTLTLLLEIPMRAEVRSSSAASARLGAASLPVGPHADPGNQAEQGNPIRSSHQDSSSLWRATLQKNLTSWRHRASTREVSPTKKARTVPGWEEFLDALSAKYVVLSDPGFGLQQELRSSPQARSDFLALNLTTPDTLHYDPEHGKLHERTLYYLADKFIDFMNTCNLCQDIFLFMGIYANNTLQNLSSVSIRLTGVA